MRDEYDGRDVSAACAPVRPACVRGSSRPARRTARPSAAMPGSPPAPGRWRPAAACRRTVAAAGARRSRPARPAPAVSARPCPALGSVDPVHLERQLDVRRDRAPLEQPGLLEREAVVLVEAGLPADLPLTRTVPGGRRDRDRRSRRSSVDLPQPDGPISETNSPALRRSGRCPSSAVDLAAARVEDLVDADDPPRRSRRLRHRRRVPSVVARRARGRAACTDGRAATRPSTAAPITAA